MYTYPNDTGTLNEGIDERIARAADVAYAEDGSSLYDQIINTSRDRDTIDDMILRSRDAIVARFYDIASVDGNSFDLNIPDFPVDSEGHLEETINTFIINDVCRRWFEQKRPAIVPEYTALAQSAMDRLAALVRTRKDPMTA